MAVSREALFYYFTGPKEAPRSFCKSYGTVRIFSRFNDTHSVPLSVSTTISFYLTVALFHKPLLEKHPQPHFSQLSKDTASHKAHASINNRYTIKGTEIAVAVGKVDKLLS